MIDPVWISVIAAALSVALLIFNAGRGDFL